LRDPLSGEKQARMLTARFDFLRTHQRAGTGKEGTEEDEE
jgi:hypothetical protein